MSQIEHCKICGALLPLKTGSGRYAQYCQGSCRQQAHRNKHVYNITSNTYHELHRIQRGVCAICGDKSSLVVDHDHATNQVRGLLCSRCNNGLGCFKR